MKFLLISEYYIDVEQYMKMYIGDYIEHLSDVIIQYSVDGAKKFLINQLITKQKHFDFMIADFRSDQFFKDYRELTQWLRDSSLTYSNKNFKLSSLPVFLMNNIMMGDRHFQSILNEQIENLFDGIVRKPEDNKRIGITNNPLAKGIEIWLDKLKSDIDDLDMNITSDFSKVDIRILNSRSYKLRVLSHSFIDNKKPLDYLWVGNSLNIIESTGDALIALLKTYNQNPSKRNEKQIHEFLKSYNHLLKSDTFEKSIYEQHFYHQKSMKYEEVDFWNIAHNYSINKNEFFEVKLPNQRFFSKRDFNVLKPAQRYFHQIGTKYYNFFSNELNLEEIKAKANKHYVSVDNLDFQYTLLMGLDEDKQQNIEGLDAFTSTLKADVRLLTYDDLLKRHHYLHSRVTKFGIN